MADNDPIAPAPNSLAATLGGSSVPNAPTEHKAVEKAAGVSRENDAPSVLLKRGDIIKDIQRSQKVTVLKPYVARGNDGIPIHEVANAKSGERWLQWETNLRR